MSLITIKLKIHTKQHSHSINGRGKVLLCHSISYPHATKNTDHYSTQITELKMHIKLLHDFDQELISLKQNRKSYGKILTNVS